MIRRRRPRPRPPPARRWPRPRVRRPRSSRSRTRRSSARPVSRKREEIIWRVDNGAAAGQKTFRNFGKRIRKVYAKKHFVNADRAVAFFFRRRARPAADRYHFSGGRPPPPKQAPDLPPNTHARPFDLSRPIRVGHRPADRPRQKERGEGLWVPRRFPPRRRPKRAQIPKNANIKNKNPQSKPTKKTITAAPRRTQYKYCDSATSQAMAKALRGGVELSDDEQRLLNLWSERRRRGRRRRGRRRGGRGRQGGRQRRLGREPCSVPGGHVNLTDTLTWLDTDLGVATLVPGTSDNGGGVSLVAVTSGKGGLLHWGRLQAIDAGVLARSTKATARAAADSAGWCAFGASQAKTRSALRHLACAFAAAHAAAHAHEQPTPAAVAGLRDFTPVDDNMCIVLQRLLAAASAGLNAPIIGLARLSDNVDERGNRLESASRGTPFRASSCRRPPRLPPWASRAPTRAPRQAGTAAGSSWAPCGFPFPPPSQPSPPPRRWVLQKLQRCRESVALLTSNADAGAREVWMRQDGGCVRRKEKKGTPKALRAASRAGKRAPQASSHKTLGILYQRSARLFVAEVGRRSVGVSCAPGPCNSQISRSACLAAPPAPARAAGDRGQHTRARRRGPGAPQTRGPPRAARTAPPC